MTLCGGAAVGWNRAGFPANQRFVARLWRPERGVSAACQPGSDRADTTTATEPAPPANPPRPPRRRPVNRCRRAARAAKYRSDGFDERRTVTDDRFSRSGFKHVACTVRLPSDGLSSPQRNGVGRFQGRRTNAGCANPSLRVTAPNLITIFQN